MRTNIINVEQSKSQTFKRCQVRFQIKKEYNFKTLHFSAGGDAWTQHDLFRQYEAKNYERKTSSHRSPTFVERLKPVCMFLMNVIYQIIKLMRPFTYSLRLTYYVCFDRSHTIDSIQMYAVWFYEAYLKIWFEMTEERVIRYSYGFFFPENEKQYPNGLIFYGLEVLLNLTGMFTMVFALAMAFYPIITFLSLVIVLFILFQTIVNQGIVNYYYYFSK